MKNNFLQSLFIILFTAVTSLAYAGGFTISAIGPITFCQGGSVTLTLPNYVSGTYTWSNGATTKSIVVTTSGTYNASASCCGTSGNSITVTVLPGSATPVITASGPLSFNYGDSVTLTSTNNDYFQWTDGNTGQSVTAHLPGVYKVYVKNTSGCTASSSQVVVTVNNLPHNPVTADFAGLSSAGGNGMGTLFKINNDGSSFGVVHQFGGLDLYYPGTLMQASDGLLYGGAGNTSSFHGVIYRYNPATNSIGIIHHFDGSDGSEPNGGLMQASNGIMYGMTTYGGVGNGTIFRLDPVTDAFTKIFDFPGNGFSNESPYGDLTEATGGHLYGVTRGGGANGDGTFFSIDTATNAHTLIHSFTHSIDGSGSGCTLLKASNGKLYGYTNNGGANNMGCLFSYDPADSSYTMLLNYTYATGGGMSLGKLAQGPDGRLYGATNYGGAGGHGTVYAYDINTNSITVLSDLYAATGYEPDAGVTFTASGRLYGTTKTGGTMGKGVIYTIDLATSAYTVVLNFEDAAGYISNSLIQLSNGNLAGNIPFGGTYNAGVIYQLDTASGSFASYKPVGGDIEGSSPCGTPVMGGDGKLYGTTAYGGLFGKGTLFSLDTATSVYEKLYDFDGEQGSGGPGNARLYHAANGKLYGTCPYGGASGNGVIFSYNPATYSYHVIQSLSFNMGSNPYSGMIEAADGKLYGTTVYGVDEGAIYSIDPADDSFTTVHGFSGITGNNPTGQLVEGPGGLLYGLNYEDPDYNFGTLYSFNPIDFSTTDLYVFNDTNGRNPAGGLVRASDGKLYGRTTGGGSNNMGVLFSYNPADSTFVKLLDFDSNTGFVTTTSSIIEGENGILYALCDKGGTDNGGSILKYNIANGIYTVIKNLDATSGIYPTGDLLSFNALPHPVALTTGGIATPVCQGPVSVPFNTSGTFNAGNVFTAQLSNSTGSFASPVSIGSLAATSEGVINATIPGTATAGTNYRIRVVASNPAVTAIDNGANIKVMTRPKIKSAVTPVSCYGQNNGAINLTLTGSAALFSYAWSNGATIQDQTGLSPATYTVTVTRSNGCTAEWSGIITEPSVLDVVAGKTNESASGAADGIARAKVTGGTTPYHYQWSTGATTRVISGLNPGTYTVTVTDKRGCNDTKSCVIITKPVKIGEGLQESDGMSISCLPNPSTGKVTISLYNLKKDAMLNITDVTGKVVQTENIIANDEDISVDLDLTRLSSGIYAATINDGSNPTTIRIVRW